MSKYVVQPYTKASYDLSYFKEFSADRMKAVALMAEVGLPLYKIHHSIVIGDVALLIADGVEKLEGVKVDRYVCEMGALLHDVGISQIQKDDMPEHAFIGAQIARDAGYSEEVARCIELHDFAGLTKEYVEGANLPCVIDKEDKLPVTWEEKIVAYADMIVSLEGEWFMDVWNDDTCACRAYCDLLSIVFKTRTGRVLTKDHPQFQHEIDFNREMRKYIPRDVYETIRPRILRMRDTIRLTGETLPFPSLEKWD